MTTKLKNNITTTLSVSLTTGSLSMTVAPGRGADWADCVSPHYAYTTLENPGGTAREVVKVTARSGDVLTIVRSQDGTTDPGSTWDTTTIVERRLNVAAVTEAAEQAHGSRGSVAMHATTMDLWTTGSKIWDGTGSAVTVTDIADAPKAGAVAILYPIVGSIITDGATFDVDGGGSHTATAGTRWTFEAVTTSTFKVHVSADAIDPSRVSGMENTSVSVFGLPSGTTAERETGLDYIGIRYNTTIAAVEVWNGTIWKSFTTTAITGIKQALFAYGTNVWGTHTPVSTSNKVSNVGVVATDTAGVGTARIKLAGCGYGANLGSMAYGRNSAGTPIATKNLIGATGVVATDVAGVGTVRLGLAAARYSTDKGLYGYGGLWDTSTVYSMTNLLSNTGVIAADTTGVGTARQFLGGASYGEDKAIFAYGELANSGNQNVSNLVSNTGVVATDTTGVGTARDRLAASDYGYDKAIFGYGGGYYSMTNLVSNTGVVATDTTGVGTGRMVLAAAGYNYDKAIFGYGATGDYTEVSMTNLVTGVGIVGADVTGVGTARAALAACSFANS